MSYVYLVIVLALFQYIYFSVSVGKARETYKIAAPATSGNEIFERYYRVQMNTLEVLIAFIPAMLIAPTFWSQKIIAAIGSVFIVGRFLYFKEYIKDPTKRTLGFALTIIPTLILLIASLIGILKTLF